jgi:hypothetical protein
MVKRRMNPASLTTGNTPSPAVIAKDETATVAVLDALASVREAGNRDDCLNRS